MAVQLTIPETIEVGELSVPLAALYQEKKKLFGGTVLSPVPPIQMTIVLDILKWGYNGGAQSDQTLRQIANYGYWMWGKFQLQAQNIISGPGGGSVVPTPSGGVSINDLDFIVSASSIIPSGATSVYFDGSGGRPDFRGMNVNFNRGAIPQYTTNPLDGSIFFGWNKVTGHFQLLGTDAQALDGERFRIMPDTGSAGSSSSSTAEVTRIVVTGSDFEGDGVTLLNSFVAEANSVLLTPQQYTGNSYLEGTFFTKTADGLVITEPGFDANNYPFIIIDKLS